MRRGGWGIGAGLWAMVLQACVATPSETGPTVEEGTAGEELMGAMPGGDGSGACPAPPGAPPLAPPPEALEACEGKTPGEACGFVPPPRPVEGVCRPGPSSEDPVACAPLSPPPPPPPPPPAAFEACAGAIAGAACGFEMDGRVLEGTCRPGPRAEDPLGCAPPLPPLRPAPAPGAVGPSRD